MWNKSERIRWKSEHAPVAASEEPKASRQAKRLECTNLSSLEKEDLKPKPTKQPRTWNNTIYICCVCKYISSFNT